MFCLGSKTGISAIVDIINADLLEWSGEQGDEVTRTHLDESHELYKLTHKYRNELVDKLAELDDDTAELVLKEDSYSIGRESIFEALRRVTLNRVSEFYQFYCDFRLIYHCQLFLMLLFPAVHFVRLL